jgi:hypothetical protein
LIGAATELKDVQIKELEEIITSLRIAINIGEELNRQSNLKYLEMKKEINYLKENLMVKINGKEYVGNDLSINSTGTYIDGIELSKCIQVKYTESIIIWPWNFFIFCICISPWIFLFFSILSHRA